MTKIIRMKHNPDILALGVTPYFQYDRERLYECIINDSCVLSMDDVITENDIERMVYTKGRAIDGIAAQAVYKDWWENTRKLPKEEMNDN